MVIALDVVVLALAARVNIFQEFFCGLTIRFVWIFSLFCGTDYIPQTDVADLFPFALSIITLVVLLVV